MKHSGCPPPLPCVRVQSSCSTSSDLSCACLAVRSRSLCVFAGRSGGIAAETVEAAQAPTSKRKEKHKQQASAIWRCAAVCVCETCNSCASRQGDWKSNASVTVQGWGVVVVAMLFIVFVFLLFFVALLPQRSNMWRYVGRRAANTGPCADFIYWSHASSRP